MRKLLLTLSLLLVFFVFSCKHQPDIPKEPPLEYSYSAKAYCINACRNEEIENGVCVIPSTHDDGTHGSFKVVVIGGSAFKNCTNLKSVTIPNTIGSMNSYCFYGCSNLKTVVIPNSVKEMYDECFAFCSSLTDVTISNKVTTFWRGPFQHCSSLKNVNFQEDSKLKGISNSCFAYCTSLETIKLPASVTTIEGCAFQGCSSLKKITIPNSVTSISKISFASCSNIEVTYGGTKDEWNTLTQDKTFMTDGEISSVICTDGTITGSKIRN